MTETRNKKGMLRKLPEVVKRYRAAEAKQQQESNLVDNRPKFVMVEIDVCDSPKLPAEAKLLYMMLLRCCHFGEREVPISRKELADYIGWSLPTLDNYLQLLKTLGLISSVEQYDKSGNQIENRWVIKGPYEAYQAKETKRLLKILHERGLDGLLGELEGTPHLKNLVAGVLKDLDRGEEKILHTPHPKKLGTNILKDSLENQVKEKDESAQTALRLAKHLGSRILANKPDCRSLPETESDWQRWASEMKKLLVADGRDAQRIEQVIDWCHLESDFWFRNILSPSTLRSKFDRLELDMRGQTSPPRMQPRGSRYAAVSGMQVQSGYPPEAEDLLRYLTEWESALDSDLPESRLKIIREGVASMRAALQKGEYDYRPSR